MEDWRSNFTHTFLVCAPVTSERSAACPMQFTARGRTLNSHKSKLSGSQRKEKHLFYQESYLSFPVFKPIL
jgi:hypothetical protein